MAVPPQTPQVCRACQPFCSRARWLTRFAGNGLNYTWSCFVGGSTCNSIFADRAAATMTLPAGSLLAGQQYVFTLEVARPAPAAIPLPAGCETTVLEPNAASTSIALTVSRLSICS